MSQGAPENPFPLVKGTPPPHLACFACTLSEAGSSGTFMTGAWGDREKARCKYQTLPTASDGSRLINSK